MRRITTSVFILIVMVGLISMIIELRHDKKVDQQKIKTLESSQNTMVWTMDKSCFDQIKNSYDGVLRIKIQKHE